jgi:hypothetical protein
MKKNYLFIVLMITSIFLSAQTLKPGYYVTPDGVYYRNIEVQADGSIKASISTGYDLYVKESGNLYKGKTTVINGESKPASRVFYLEVISETSIKMYREGETKYTLNLKTTESIAENIDDCALYQKYMDKMEDEPENIQVLAFCANAALQLCDAPDDDTRNTILEITVKSLKGLIPGQPCPCQDVISTANWNKY